MKNIGTLLLVCLTLSLSACIPAAFVAGATAGGVVISDRRSIKTIVSDKKITCQALMRLNSDSRLKEKSHLAVTTFNGVVLLVGEAQTPELKCCAYELVKAVPEIRRINNEISVGESLSTKECSNDAWITTKVKTALLRERGLRSTQIKVLTEDSIVYLLGLVTHSQADIAVEVARTVKGVRKVVTLFEYVSNN